MQAPKWLLALPPLALLLAGCASTITNLTPSILPREQSGLYPFEAEWTSTQRSRSLREDSIRGYVVVNGDFHPMERVPGMKSRWEALVPLQPTNQPVLYHFKWDYSTAGFGADAPNSVRSRQYRLEIR